MAGAKLEGESDLPPGGRPCVSRYFDIHYVPIAETDHVPRILKCKTQMRIRKLKSSSDREPTPDPFFPFIIIVLFIIVPVWYLIIGMSMTLLKDTALICHSSDLGQLIIIILVWVVISGLMVWLASGVFNLLIRKK